MKKNITLITLTLTIFALTGTKTKAQNLTTISPNEAIEGQTIDVVITGVGTHFTQGTTSSIILTHPDNSYILPSEDYEVIDDTTIHANVHIAHYTGFMGGFYGWSPETKRGLMPDYESDFGVRIDHSVDGILILHDAFNISNCRGGDCVWTGDANNDGLVDNFDILNIGVAYGITGPNRSSYNTWNHNHSQYDIIEEEPYLWKGWYCDDWGQSFSDGVNYKFADADGSGEIGSFDVSLVDQLYSTSHDKANNVNGNSAVDPALQIIAANETLSPGEKLNLSIQLGDSNIEATDVYGTAFSIYYNSELFEADSLVADFTDSWVGDEADIATLIKNFPEDGRLDVAITRTDQNNVSGKGPIMSIGMVMVQDVIGKVPTDGSIGFSIENAKVSNAELEEIMVAIQNDSVDVLTGIMSTSEELRKPVSRYVYPNPVKDQVSIQIDQDQQVQFFDAMGKAISVSIMSNTPRGVVIDMSHLESGFYYAEIQDKSELVLDRVNVVKQ